MEKTKNTKYMAKVAENNGSLRVAIPKPVAEFLGIQVGDIIEVGITKPEQ